MKVTIKSGVSVTVHRGAKLGIAHPGTELVPLDVAETNDAGVEILKNLVERGVVEESGKDDGGTAKAAKKAAKKAGDSKADGKSEGA